MRRLRLALDGSLLDRAKSGIGWHMEHLARALAVHEGIAELAVFGLYPPRWDGPPPRVAEWTGPSLGARDLWMQAALPLVLRKHRPDLTHFLNFMAPVQGAEPYVVTVHDLAVFRHPEFFGAKKRFFARGMIARAARRARAVLTVSQTMREEIASGLQIDPLRIHVTYPAPADSLRRVDDEARLASARTRHRLVGPFLLFVGTIEPRKNLGCLLDACEALWRRDAMPHQLAVVGGRGWQSDALLARLRTLAEGPRVRHLEYVDTADLAALYSAADGFVFPTLYEGFGVPPLEAMRCGTPVLASDLPVVREVLGEAALFVAPDDRTSWESALLRFTEDAELRARLADAGSKREALYRWPATAEAAVAAYRAALG